MDGTAKVSLILELKERIKSGLNKAKAVVNENVKEMKDKLNSLKVSSIEAFKGMGDQIPGFSNAVALLKNPFALVTAAVLALAAAYGSAVGASLEWESKMAHANVTAQLTKGGLKNLSDQLRTIGGNNVADLDTVPDAFNRIISAGLDSKRALDALEPTLRAAKAGFADMETTAAAGVGVMNSSGEDINKVYDVLFATVNKGNAEFKDIAQYLPKIIPNAKAAGFALGETAGAWAYLTAQGRSSEQATTGLLNTFKAFSNPETFKGLKEIGVKVFDATGTVRPLIDIITQLQTKMHGLSDRKRATLMGSLGIDMEGLGAINAMMQDTAKLKDTIDFTTNSQGALNQAYSDAATSTDSWRIIMNKVKVEILGVGDTALPVIEKVGQWFLDNGPVLEKFAYAIGGVTAAWLTYGLVTNAVGIASGLLTGAMWLLNVAMNANPVGLLITAIGLLIGGLVYAYKHCDTFRAGIQGLIEVGKTLWELFEGLGKVLIGVFTFDPKMVIDGVKQTADVVSGIMGGSIGKAFHKGFDESMASNQVVNGGDQSTLNESILGQKHEAFSMVPKDAFGDKKTAPTKAKKLDNKIADDSVNKVTDNKPVRNITVNIDSFVKGGINSSNTAGLNGMSGDDIEKWFNNMLMRAITNLETSYN